MDQARIVQYGEPEDIVRNPANDYVADFVGHMNPLNVLRGRTLMTAASDIPRDADELLLDRAGYCRVRLDGEGKPTSATSNGIASEIVIFSTDDGISALADTNFAVASPDIMLRDVIEIRHKTGSPVLFAENGKLVGMIGDDEIFEGFLR